MLYLSRSQAPVSLLAALTLHFPTGSTWPGTETSSCPVGAVQRSHVTRKKTMRKPAFLMPPFETEGSPEPCPRRWNVCPGTAPLPTASDVCLAQRNTQRPRSFGAARLDPWSGRGAGVGRPEAGFGTCFQYLNLSPCC